jgi:hypothetical protein
MVAGLFNSPKSGLLISGRQDSRGGGKNFSRMHHIVTPLPFPARFLGKI